MKILIVDDNSENIDMMTILLKSQNYEVISAINGKEALELAHSNKFDLIISDILMPVMDGFQFCRECKKDQELSKICFVFYTATYIDAKDEEFALSLGAQEFIRKPQEPEVLLKMIKAIAENPCELANASITTEKQDENEVLKLYSERLVAKLEKKNLDLEQEIASHQLTESKLKESEERFSLAVESIQNGLWDWNIDTGYVYQSDYYALMLGFEPEELDNSVDAWMELLHPDDKDLVVNKNMDYLAGKTNEYEATYRMRDKNNQYRWIYSRGKALFDKKGKAYRFIGFNEDITEKKKQEQELIKAKDKAEESDRLKTAFLHNISHEIRTPLNGIIGFSDILSKPDLDPGKQKHFSQIVRNSGNQLLSIVEDIISIATIESGIEKPNETESNVNELLQMINNQVLLKSGNKNLSYTINSSLTDDEATIWVDKIKLFQILTNLVNNAIKFTLTGYVKVNCWRKNGLIEFSVEDTGIGIAREMHEKVFERFYQVEYSNTRFYGGTGLGLSIVKSYVEFLKGTIQLHSELGKGSKFVVSIPYHPVIQKIPTAVHEKPLNNPIVHSTVLIVDDELANIQLLDEYLSDLELTILHASDGIQAVEACKNNPSISLVLMDLKMPRMGGYEAAQQIKSFRPEMHIIIQSAYVNRTDADESVNAFINGFIEKPIKQRVLLEMMQKVMG